MDFEKNFNLVGAGASLTFTMAEKHPVQNLLDALDEAPTTPKKPQHGRPPGTTSSKKKKN